MQLCQASVSNEAAARQFPCHLHFLPAKCFLHPYPYFHCNPSWGVCVQDKDPLREAPQLAKALVSTAGRGSQGLMDPKQCLHLGCLHLMDTLHSQPHGQMGSPGARPEQAQLCGCGQPLSQILSLFHSWFHEVGLPRHLSSHIKTRGIWGTEWNSSWNLSKATLLPQVLLNSVFNVLDSLGCCKQDIAFPCVHTSHLCRANLWRGLALWPPPADFSSGTFNPSSPFERVTVPF